MSDEQSRGRSIHEVDNAPDREFDCGFTRRKLTDWFVYQTHTRWVLAWISSGLVAVALGFAGLAAGVGGVGAVGITAAIFLGAGAIGVGCRKARRLYRLTGYDVEHRREGNKTTTDD